MTSTTSGAGPLHSNSAQAALALRTVTHKYGARTALRGVDLTVGPGVTALVGINGAGKSTLMRISAGGLAPDSGRVEICGINPYGSRSRRLALKSISLMPQEARFPGNMTPHDLVRYVAWMRGAASSDAGRLARKALARVGLSDRADDRIRELSGGMVRRVALAQAIAAEPEVLLLDEPSTGLDPQQRRLMVELLSQLDGCILLSSHVMEDVVEVADRVVVLHEGQIAFDGSVPELQGRAPTGSPAGRTAEFGFLRVISAGCGEQA